MKYYYFTAAYLFCALVVTCMVFAQSSQMPPGVGMASGSIAASGGGGSGTITGPSTSTQSNLVLWGNNSGTTLSNSAIAIPGDGTMTFNGITTASFPSGTLSALAFSGPLLGNASTATQLAAARTINGVPFDGTANISTGVTTVSGTANRVSVSGSTGAVTFTTPQDTATTSNVTYANGTFTGTISIVGGSITGMANPLNLLDVANKQYVDLQLKTFDTKNDVVCATTGALPFSPTYSNGSSGVGATLSGAVGVLVLDGYTPSLNQDILVKNEATTANNGKYKLTTVGTVIVSYVLTRTTDFDQPADIPYGATVLVLNGSSNANQVFAQGNPSVTTVGTSAITFFQTSGTAQLAAGNGITFTGNTIGLTTSTMSIAGKTVTLGSSIALASTDLSNSSNINLLDANQTITGTKTMSGSVVFPNFVNTLLGTNSTGSLSAIVSATVSAALDLISSSQGVMLVRGASTWGVITPSTTTSYVLTSTGSLSAPTFQAAAGGGVTTVNTSTVSSTTVPSASIAGSTLTLTNSAPSHYTQTISYASTITPSLAVAGTNVINVATLTGNITISNTTGYSLQDGDIVIVNLHEDATAGRTVTFGSNYKFTTIAPQSAAQTATPNFIWYWSFIYNSQTGHLINIGYNGDIYSNL